MKGALVFTSLALSLCSVGCMAVTQKNSAQSHATCDAIPGVSELLARDKIRYVVIGELHGTNETPKLFAELVCSAAKMGKRVLVGLEFDESARPSFETFLSSDGTSADRLRFFQETGWLVSEGQQDGRTSRSMLQMLERLRALRSADLSISITTFVRPGAFEASSQTPYEVALATSLREVAEAGDYDLAFVLVGGLHAQKSRFHINESTYIDPMVMHLPRHSTVTLSAVYADGEAWNCQQTCGVHRYVGSPSADEPSIKLGNQLSVGYDGILTIGPISASPPVEP